MRPERDILLRFIGDNHIENIYLIAGDLHSSHSMTAECGPKNAPVTIHEFCSTPFEQDCNKSGLTQNEHLHTAYGVF